jgi:parvulin-like peptidyl-prolyl isomerase
MFFNPCIRDKTSEVYLATDRPGRFKKDFRSFFLILILPLALSSCASIIGTPTNTPTPPRPTETPKPPTPTPPPSAATVNGEFITLAEFEAELDRYESAQTALGKNTPKEEAEKLVLENLITQVLLSQGAREAGFDLTEADLEARIESLAAQAGGPDQLQAWRSMNGYEDDELFQLALKRAVEAAWIRDKIIADVPGTIEQVHVRQILTYNLDDARAAFEQLKAGMDFDELAALYDPLTRGELGWIPRGYLLDPDADEAVFALETGAYSDVIETDAGFHIFKVIERGVQPLSPDALLTVQEQALQDWVTERRAQSEVVITP